MSLPYPGWNVVYGEIPAATKWSQLGANLDALAAGTGMNDNSVGSRIIQLANNEAIKGLDSAASEKDLIKLAADDYARLGRFPQQGNTTNTTKDNIIIQYGWTYTQGNGTNTSNTKAVTFPKAFTSPPAVILTPLGETGATPTTPYGTNLGGVGYAPIPRVGILSATGFSWQISAQTTGNPWNSATTLIASWIAIGEA